MPRQSTAEKHRLRRKAKATAMRRERENLGQGIGLRALMALLSRGAKLGAVLRG